MARTKKTSQESARIPEVTRTKNPFAFPLKPDTPLGNAMLIAEFADGTHQPVDVVSNIAEACEIAESDLRLGKPGKRAATYVLWARGVNGAYHVATRLTL